MCRRCNIKVDCLCQLVDGYCASCYYLVNYENKHKK
jgi:hypothetical protein